MWPLSIAYHSFGMEPSLLDILAGTSKVQSGLSRESCPAMGELSTPEYLDARSGARHYEQVPHLVLDNSGRMYE